jgi:hypothetical protein
MMLFCLLIPTIGHDILSWFSMASSLQSAIFSLLSKGTRPRVPETASPKFNRMVYRLFSALSRCCS